MATRLELVEDVGRLQGLAARGDRSDLREIRRLAAGLKRALEARRPPAPPRPRAAPVPVAAISGDLARLSGLLEHLRVPRTRDAERVEAALRLISAVRQALDPRGPQPPAPAPGAPPLPLQGLATGIVTDCPLGCSITALGCTARQIQSQLEREGQGSRFAKDPKRRRDRAGRPPELARHDTKRGSRASRPTCVTSLCPVGAVVRALHGDTPEAIEMARRAPSASDTVEG